jgi:hypothetical protein
MQSDNVPVTRVIGGWDARVRLGSTPEVTRLNLKVGFPVIRRHDRLCLHKR